MVSEKPPRRSKVEKEPVTIDLTAEESSPVAEPVRSNDTDEPVKTPKPTEDAIAETGRADTASTSEPPPSYFMPDDKAAVTEPAAEDTMQTEPRPDAEKAPDLEETKEQPEPASAAPEPEPEQLAQPAPPQPASTRTSPATTTLIAAGIFGGIVALFLAGSMQYAGYLPGATPSSGNAGGSSSELAELRQEIAALRSRPAGTDSALASRVTALEASSKTSGGGNDQAVAALKADLDRLRATVQTSASNDAALAQRLNAAETKLNDSGAEQQVARAVAAAALKAAIDRGGRFETELQTYAAVSADDPAVADLQKFAAAGVPSRAELQREFPRVADAMLEATIQPDPNQGIAGRLLSSAMSVVKVRRVGDVEGDTPEAIIARMEEKLRNGDLQASAQEWDKLPETAKAVSRDFKQKLDARQQVETLVGGTLTRAVAGTRN